MSLKNFSKTTLIYSIGTLALRFTMFLLIPLYTNYLSVAEFGLLQTLLFTIQIIITVVDVGMRSALMRFFPEYEKSNNIGFLFGTSFSINLLSGLILILFSLSISDSMLANFFDTKNIPNVVLLTVIVGIAQTLSLNAISYFRAKEMGIAYTIISVIGSISLIVVTYINLVILDLGIIGVLWAQLFVFTSMWLIVLFQILSKHGLKIDPKLFKVLAKFGYPLIFAMSGDLIINTAGNYFLGFFRSLQDVAIYSLGYKIASISLMILINPFQMAYEPYVFKHKDEPQITKIIARIIDYILFVYVLVSFIIVFVFKDLIHLLGKSEYFEAYKYVYWILPGIAFLIFNYIGQSLLHIKNKTKLTGKIVLSVTTLSLIVLYFSTEKYGIEGLIFSINLYLICSSILLFLFGIKEIPLKLNYNKILSVVISGIFLLITIYYLSFCSDYIFYTFSIVLFLFYIILFFYSRFFEISEKEFLFNYIKKIRS